MYQRNRTHHELKEAVGNFHLPTKRLKLLVRQRRLDANDQGVELGAIVNGWCRFRYS